MQKTIISALFTVVCLSPVMVQAEDKPVDLRIGQDLYEQLCVNCHSVGIDGAPRLGAKEDWLKLLPLGQETLYQAVLEGPNHMYSKGNSPIESEGQIRSMVGYMMNSVVDAETAGLIDAASAEEKARHLQIVRGYKMYDLVCFKCHASGDEGAPRLGMPADWTGRKDKGVDALAKSVINGKGHMYMRAGTANQSEADYKSMVTYMLSTLDGK